MDRYRYITNPEPLDAAREFLSAADESELSGEVSGWAATVVEAVEEVDRIDDSHADWFREYE